MSRNKAQRELNKLRALLKDTFGERRITDTGTVTEVIRDRITDASGNVLAGGKVRKLRFSASGLDDQVVRVPDGTAVSVGDAIHVTRSASRTVRPDWQFVRVVRTTAALGGVQDAGRHVSTPVGFQVQSAGIQAATPGGNAKAWVQLTWTENPAHEGVAQYFVAYRVDGETAWHVVADDVPPLRIRDLEVSTTYNFRIRAVNGHGVMSNWSSIISYTTSSDATLPIPPGGNEGDAVTNLVANFMGINCVITWDDVVLTDDFSHYEIQIYSDSSETTLYRTVTRRANSYTYTFDDNQEDGAGTADPTLYIKVRAVDYTGNTNAWATVSATNSAPTAITGFSYDWDENDLHLWWTGPTISTVPDLAYYRVRIYTSNGGTLLRDVGVTNHPAFTYTSDMNRADNTKAATGQTIDTSLYVIVNAVDGFGQNSTDVTASPTKPTPGTITVTVANFDGLSAKLDWDDVGHINFDKYKVVITGNGGAATYYPRSSFFEYTVNMNVRDNGAPDPSLTYAISWLDKHGQESTPTTGSLTNTAPVAPTGVSATGATDQIDLAWNENSEDDLLLYKVYASQTSGFTPSAGNLVWQGRATAFTHAVGASQTWYYRVSAVDWFANESAKAAEVSATSADVSGGTPSLPSDQAITLSTDIETDYGAYDGIIWATWNQASGAVMYEVRWKLTDDTYYQTARTKDSGSATTTYQIYGLIPGKEYGVNVRGLSSYDEATAWYNSGVDTTTTITDDAIAPLAGFTGHHKDKVDADRAFGDATATQWRAQGFQFGSDATVRVARLWLKKVGTPTDNLTVEIQTDSAGVPSGTVVGTSDVVAGSGLSTSYGWVAFRFSTPVSITASTQYHVVVKRSGALDAANYYVWGVDASSSDYSGGTFATHNGTTWSADSTVDGAFEVTDFDVVAGTLKVTLTWTNPPDVDAFRVQIYRNTADSTATAVPVALVACHPGQPQQYVDQFDDDSNPFDAGTTYYYWLRFTDRPGNVSSFTASESSAVGGVDNTVVTVTGQAVVTSRQLDLELMRQSFNILSWAQFAIFEAFDDETKRASPDPATYDARVYYGTLDNGEDNTPNRAFGFNSKTYTDITTVHTGTSTAVGLNYLEDNNSSWFDGQYKNYILIDSALTEFTISDSVDSTNRLVVSGTPAAGAYSIKAQNPTYAVAFCTYKDSTNGGGTGTTKLEVSFDGGTNWQTFLDTSVPTNLLEGLVSIANTGNDYRFRVTLTNDGSGNGAVVYKVLVCTDPSVWQ